MSEINWFNDPKQLFNKKYILNFWPTDTQTPATRINSTSRFVIYSASCIYLIKRDVRIFVLALMIISVLYVLDKSNLISDTDTDDGARPTRSTAQNYSPDCQLPTADNPLANVLISDYTDNPNRSPACYFPTVQKEVKKLLNDTIPYDCGRSRCALPKYQQRAAARQFVSNPVTTIPGDQTAFAEWCYGKKHRPMCRDDPSKCNPDYWGVQSGAFSGIAPNGDKR